VEEILARVARAATQAESAAHDLSVVRELARRGEGLPSHLTNVESELLELAAAGLAEATSALRALGQALDERRDGSDGQ
jgi:hypothetical protein